MEVISSITRLSKIFKNKGWFEKDEEEFAFNNFCFLLEVLEPDERVLLLELTERYTWISASDYAENIIKAFALVPQEKIEKLKKIYLFPILKLKDEAKNKSGNSLMYDLKGITFKFQRYKDIIFKAVNSYKEIQAPFRLNEDESLFLIDDYIGGGGTLSDCLIEITKNPNLDMRKVNVVSISCQKETYEKILADGVCIYTPNILQKGISDFHQQPTIDEKKALMRSIEESIPGSKKFSLGWEESEGIITLKRTPNNTFPIFWKNFRRHGKQLEAPFVRTQNFIE